MVCSGVEKEILLLSSCRDARIVTKSVPLGELNEAQRANLPLELPPDAERTTSRRLSFPRNPRGISARSGHLTREHHASRHCSPAAAQLRPCPSPSRRLPRPGHQSYHLPALPRQRSGTPWANRRRFLGSRHHPTNAAPAHGAYPPVVLGPCGGSGPVARPPDRRTHRQRTRLFWQLLSVKPRPGPKRYPQAHANYSA